MSIAQSSLACRSLSNYLIPKSRPGSASQSTGNIALLTTFTAIIYFFVKVLFMNRPVDKHGYPIPYGPIGLPILGQCQSPSYELF